MPAHGAPRAGELMRAELRAEAQALRRALAHMRRVVTADRDMHAAQRIVERTIARIERMAGAGVSAPGVRHNPPLVVFANPGRATGGVMSRDVQAVIYRHAEDGAAYVHGFGNAELELDTEDGALTIRGLLEQTGVVMRAEHDGSITMRRDDGVALWREF